MTHRASCIIRVLLGLSLFLFGCGSSGGPAAGGAGGAAGTGGLGGTGGGSPRLVVTADWLNQSLTLLDYDRLIDGESDAASAIVDTIDLSEWEPGPIELELTPDGKTAVVSVGPAFFDSLSGLLGDPEIPPGGTLLIVDLETGAADEIQTEDVPLGIAISPDGSRAYTANYGTNDARGDTVSIVDIPGRRLIENVQVGGGPEQIALSPDGSLGIVNVVSGGGIRVFQTSDVAGTLSEVVETGSDPSDVSFVGGNDRAVAANSFGFDVTLIDTSDPSSPSVLESVQVGTGVPYGVTDCAARNQILAPTNATGRDLPTHLVAFAVSGDSLSAGPPLSLPGQNFPLTAAIDSGCDFAFVAHIVDRKLSIIDLETNATRAIEWLSEPGPSYVAVQP
jgi:YVTN family beta-propeller protein